MLVKLAINEFSQVLASDAPAPGGGSVAALSGALGADLVCMVCSLSSGRSEFAAYEGDIARALEATTSLSRSLLDCVDRDTEAFNGVMAAFKLPKSTDEEKAARREAIQRGYKDAVQSPLRTARECLEVVRIAENLFGKTNSNALSDLAVGAEQAHAGLMGAVMNIRINLPSIKDEGFVAEMRKEADALIREGDATLKRVRERFTEDVA